MVTKVKGAVFDAEVFGKLREVKFQEGSGIQIAGLTYEESMRLLKGAATGQITPDPVVSIEMPDVAPPPAST